MRASASRGSPRFERPVPRAATSGVGDDKSMLARRRNEQRGCVGSWRCCIPAARRTGRAGGLGVAITTGVNLDLPRVLITGSILVCLLALAVDWLGRVVEHIARPRGL